MTAMDPGALPNSENMGSQPEVSVDDISSLFESFLGWLTVDQWKLLKTGNPDDATRLMLADLFLHVIIILSKVVTNTLDRKDESVSTENVLSSLCGSLAQSIIQALGLPTRNQYDDFKCLLETVSTAVNAYIDDHTHKGNANTASSSTLCSIIDHASEIFKKFMPKTFHTHREQEHSNELLLQECKEYKSLDRGTEENIHHKLCVDVHKELIKGVRIILDSILTQQSKSSSAKCSDFDITQEISSASNDIAKAINEKDEKEVKNIMKSFFINCITKTWNYRAQEQFDFIVVLKFAEENGENSNSDLVNPNRVLRCKKLRIGSKDSGSHDELAGEFWCFSSLIDWWCCARDLEGCSQRAALTLIKGSLQPVFEVETIRTMFKSFFDWLTVEQWRLVKAGKPDEATIMKLAELILDIIAIPSNIVRDACDRKDDSVSRENILSSLGDTLHESLIQALSLPKQDDCAHLKVFLDLMHNEVETFTNSTDRPQFLNCSNLKAMVDIGIRMLKEIMPEEVPTNRTHKCRFKLLDECKNKPVEDQDVPFVAVLRKLTKELRMALDYILNDLSDSSLNLLDIELCQDTTVISNEISQAIAKKDKKELIRKLHYYFTECITKAWAFRTKEHIYYTPLDIKFTYKDKERFRVIEMVDVSPMTGNKGSSDDCSPEIYRKVWAFHSLMKWWTHQSSEGIEWVSMFLMTTLNTDKKDNVVDVAGLFEQFFKGLTNAQWRRYLSGDRDSKGREKLVEILVEIRSPYGFVKQSEMDEYYQFIDAFLDMIVDKNNECAKARKESGLGKKLKGLKSKTSSWLKKKFNRLRQRFSK